MGTPFNKVYNTFLRTTVARETELYTEEELKALLRAFLVAAVLKFNNSRIDLSFDKVNEGQFKQELGEQEIYVLVAFMKHEYTKTFLFDDYNLAPRPTFRDMGFGSQAAYLRELEKRELRARDEAYEALTRYSRQIANFGNLKGGAE